MIETAGAEEIAVTVAPPPGTLSADEFHKVFCAGFNVASKITKLKSLEVNDADAAAIGASHALYDTISEIPALHFILQPGGKWGQRVLLIGAFALPMCLAVKSELAERQPSAPAQANAAPANIVSGMEVFPS